MKKMHRSQVLTGDLDTKTVFSVDVSTGRITNSDEDDDTSEWPIAEMRYARSFHAAAASPNEIIVVGGENLNLAEVYSPKTNR